MLTVKLSIFLVYLYASIRKVYEFYLIAMPQCCVVPMCSSRTTGHRFPRDETLRKKWVVAIRRDKYVPTKNSRICKHHFTQSDYVMPKESVVENPNRRLKKDAIPSQFHWTGNPRVAAQQRQERFAKRSLLKECLPVSSVSSSSRLIVPEPCNDIEIPMQSVAASETQNAEVKKYDAATMTSTSPSSFCIENLQPKSKMGELKFYTGFDSYEHFWVVFNTLGPAVDHLLYYPSGCPMSVRVLTPANEFLLTIVKLRRNMINKELAFKFDISESLVSRIFITWINFLYCQFKELNVWVPFKVAKQNAKFNGIKCTSAVIIDCTEIKIDQPKNPVSQQLTYSTYKSCNTLKVLVGMSSTGNISFVSDSYGGSISDRCLFEKCGLSNLLEKNDIVLADRGFQIQDILASRDVTVNMPEFLKKKSGQLEPEQLNRSKKISSKRIHIERIIGLGKTYRILKYLSNNLVPLGSRIIFVCFMLANFRSNIMQKS